MPYQSIFGIKSANTTEDTPQQSQQKRAQQQQTRLQQIAKKKKDDEERQKQLEAQKPINRAKSLLGKVSAVGKTVANAATTGEQTTAKGIARILPGGTNDIKAQQAQAQQASKNVKFVLNQQKAGKIKKADASKIIQANAANTSQTSKQTAKTLKEMPTKGQLAAGIASTAADALTAGTLKAGKAGLTSSKVLKPLISGADKKLVPAAAEIAAHLASNAAAGGLNAAAGGGTKKDIINNAAVGAAVPEALRFGGKGISKVASKLPASKADTLRTAQNVKVQSLLSKADKSTVPVRQETEQSSILVKRPNAQKLLPAGSTKPISGKDFTMAPEANAPALERGKRLSLLQKRITNFQQGKGKMSPEEAKATAQELAALKQTPLDNTGPSGLDPTTAKLVHDTMGKLKTPNSVIEKANSEATALKTAQATTDKAVADNTKIDQKIELIEAKKADGKFTNVDKVKVEQLKAQKQPVPSETSSLTSAAVQAPDTPAPTPTPVSPSEPKANKSNSTKGTSKVAKRIASNLKEQYGDLAEYDKISIKDQATKAEALTNNRAALDRVISGEEQLPKGLRATSVITAIRSNPELVKDGELLKRLASSHLASESSRSAQELRLARENAKHDPIEAIRSVQEARKEAIERRTGKSVAKATSEEIRAIRAVRPKVTKETWGSFIESIKC